MNKTDRQSIDKVTQIDAEKASNKQVANIEPKSALEIKMDNFARLADVIANSEVYRGAFMKFETSEDGTQQIEVVSKDDIVACLLLADEFNIPPMQAIALGRKLNQDAVFKLRWAEAIGINYTSALENIHVFSTKGNKKLVYAGIHIINTILNKAKIKRVILDDGTKPYIYLRCIIGVEQGYEIEISDFDKTKHYIAGNNPEELKAKIADGYSIYTRITTRRGLVKLIRGDEEVAIPFTLEQAVEAGYYKGKKSDGTIVDGKDNWNCHPATHLVKMSVMLGARNIASDLLNGMYIAEELVQVKHSDINDDDVVEAEIVTDENIDK